MPSRLEYLFDSYVDQNCSEEEEKELMALLVKPENELLVKNLIGKVFENKGLEILMPKEVSVSILQSILQKDQPKVVAIKSRKFILTPWMRVVAAASLILCISGISYWVLKKENKEKITQSIVSRKNSGPIMPGGYHAMLTVADGSTIVLDSIQNGNLHQGGANIRKQNGLLIYDRSGPLNADAAVGYHTLTTPRGGQYEVVLPDGSKVWLNASSSIHFPTAFLGKQRDVELTGEAYFEIVKNKEKPFHVNVKNMQVEVLGTHFNVNAYADEKSIKTSLLKGSVKIKNRSESVLLRPGQQGIMEKSNQNIEIKNADLEEAIAWKNGLFQFDGANITAIMREISRWYDVDIVYAGKIPIRRFEGKISRDVPLSDVLKILELSNVKFKIEGKKIIVY